MLGFVRISDLLSPPVNKKCSLISYSLANSITSPSACYNINTPAENLSLAIYFFFLGKSAAKDDTLACFRYRIIIIIILASKQAPRRGYMVAFKITMLHNFRLILPEPIIPTSLHAHDNILFLFVTFLN